MNLVFIVLLVLQIGVLLMTVYAFVHAAIQRPDAYTAADKMTKPVWLLILGGATLLTLLFRPVGAGDGRRRLRVGCLPRRRAAQASRDSGQVAIAVCEL